MAISYWKFSDSEEFEEKDFEFLGLIVMKSDIKKNIKETIN